LNDYSKERHYRAPEILLGATHLTEKVDVWSLGCIFGEMMTSEVLFNGNSTLNQLERIVELMGKPSENESMGSEMAESILYAVQSTKIKVSKKEVLYKFVKVILKYFP
jgi:mitogen-activated protein kinase 15